ncbi:Transcription factor TBF1, partial [Smittium culicis]
SNSVKYKGSSSNRKKSLLSSPTKNLLGSINPFEDTARSNLELNLFVEAEQSQEQNELLNKPNSESVSISDSDSDSFNYSIVNHLVDLEDRILADSKESSITNSNDLTQNLEKQFDSNTTRHVQANTSYPIVEIDQDYGINSQDRNSAVFESYLGTNLAQVPLKSPRKIKFSEEMPPNPIKSEAIQPDPIQVDSSLPIPSDPSQVDSSLPIPSDPSQVDPSQVDPSRVDSSLPIPADPSQVDSSLPISADPSQNEANPTTLESNSNVSPSKPNDTTDNSLCKNTISEKDSLPLDSRPVKSDILCDEQKPEIVLNNEPVKEKLNDSSNKIDMSSQSKVASPKASSESKKITDLINESTTSSVPSSLPKKQEHSDIHVSKEEKIKNSPSPSNPHRSRPYDSYASDSDFGKVIDDYIYEVSDDEIVVKEYHIPAVEDSGGDSSVENDIIADTANKEDEREVLTDLDMPNIADSAESITVSTKSTPLKETNTDAELMEIETTVNQESPKSRSLTPVTPQEDSYTANGNELITKNEAVARSSTESLESADILSAELSPAVYGCNIDFLAVCVYMVIEKITELQNELECEYSSSWYRHVSEDSELGSLFQAFNGARRLISKDEFFIDEYTPIIEKDSEDSAEYTTKPELIRKVNLVSLFGLILAPKLFLSSSLGLYSPLANGKYYKNYNQILNFSDNNNESNNDEGSEIFDDWSFLGISIAAQNRIEFLLYDSSEDSINIFIELLTQIAIHRCKNDNGENLGTWVESCFSQGMDILYKFFNHIDSISTLMQGNGFDLSGFSYLNNYETVFTVRQSDVANKSAEDAYVLFSQKAFESLVLNFIESKLIEPFFSKQDIFSNSQLLFSYFQTEPSNAGGKNVLEDEIEDYEDKDSNGYMSNSFKGVEYSSDSEVPQSGTESKKLYRLKGSNTFIGLSPARTKLDLSVSPSQRNKHSTVNVDSAPDNSTPSKSKLTSPAKLNLTPKKGDSANDTIAEYDLLPQKPNQTPDPLISAINAAKDLEGKQSSFTGYKATRKNELYFKTLSEDESVTTTTDEEIIDLKNVENDEKVDGVFVSSAGQPKKREIPTRQSRAKKDINYSTIWDANKDVKSDSSYNPIESAVSDSEFVISELESDYEPVETKSFSKDLGQVASVDEVPVTNLKGSSSWAGSKKSNPFGGDNTFDEFTPTSTRRVGVQSAEQLNKQQELSPTVSDIQIYRRRRGRARNNEIRASRSKSPRRARKTANDSDSDGINDKETNKISLNNQETLNSDTKPVISGSIPDEVNDANVDDTTQRRIKMSPGRTNQREDSGFTPQNSRASGAQQAGSSTTNSVRRSNMISDRHLSLYLNPVEVPSIFVHPRTEGSNERLKVVYSTMRVFNEGSSRGRGLKKAWTSEEIECLDRCVEFYQVGCWAKMIEHHGANGKYSNLLQNRNALQLKDKVRNIVRALKRNGIELGPYENFG